MDEQPTGGFVRDSLTDAEIHHVVGVTLRELVLPALRDDADWARTAVVQLAGLVAYAERRGPDRTSERVAEIADLLEVMAGNDLVAAEWSGDRSQAVVMSAAGAALASAVGRDDAAADEVRTILRPVLVRQLDDELAETAPLVDAFRGHLDG